MSYFFSGNTGNTKVHPIISKCLHLWKRSFCTVDTERTVLSLKQRVGPFILLHPTLLAEKSALHRLIILSNFEILPGILGTGVAPSRARPLGLTCSDDRGNRIDGISVGTGYYTIAVICIVSGEAFRLEKQKTEKAISESST